MSEIKQMNFTKLKIHFSEVVKKVKTGEEIAVTSGKKKEIVGYFVLEIIEKKKSENWEF
jgi:phage protein U